MQILHPEGVAFNSEFPFLGPGWGAGVFGTAVAALRLPARLLQNGGPRDAGPRGWGGK